jgi:hypothetical protein
LIPASEWEPAPSGNVQAPLAWVALVGALSSVGTELRHATAPPAPVEAGGVPYGVGRRAVGGTAGARSERRWCSGVRRAGARSEQRAMRARRVRWLLWRMWSGVD